MKKKRKICFVITSGIHYSRGKLVLEELRKRKDIELQIVVGASALLANYGAVEPLIERDGFRVDARITMVLEGGNSVAMAKTTGVGIMEFTTIFDNLRPDVVVVRGDRYEILAPAIAAAYLNIPLAHIEGGDRSGTIDESVRHAVTKLAHLHFTSSEEARKRVIRMGENPRYVFALGAPEIEFAAKNGFNATSALVNRLGVGDVIDIEKPFLMVMQHPVTSETGKNKANIEATLHAVNELGIPTIWFWPNVDAGTDEVSKGIRSFRETEDPRHMRFLKYLPPEEFLGLLKKASVLVGNSSAGIKEASYFGTPVVNIGTRQKGRMRGQNVLDVSNDAKAISRAISAQLEHGQYPSSKLYYKKDSSKKIARLLATLPLYTQKVFHDGRAAK